MSFNIKKITQCKSNNNSKQLSHEKFQQINELYNIWKKFPRIHELNYEQWMIVDDMLHKK